MLKRYNGERGEHSEEMSLGGQGRDTIVRTPQLELSRNIHTFQQRRGEIKSWPDKGGVGGFPVIL